MTEKEEKTSEKFQIQIKNNELLKSEIKNLMLKVQFLERKSQERIDLESILSELQKDYDEIVREKSSVIQNYENQLFYLKDENREMKNGLLENQKSICNMKKEYEELEKQCYFLEKENFKREKETKDIHKNLTRAESMVAEKSMKIEEYCQEINSINKKILDFSVLMEKLIQENQRLNIIANESQKVKRFCGSEKNLMDISKYKWNDKNENAFKFSSTMKNFGIQQSK